MVSKTFHEGLFLEVILLKKNTKNTNTAQKFVYKNSKNKKELTFSDTDSGYKSFFIQEF